MPKQVTFTGEREGSVVTVGTLIDALQKALIWLRGRDPSELVDWEVVRVQLGDPVRLTFRSESANGEISRRMNSLHNLQLKRKPTTMPRLSDAEIEGTMELASVLGNGFRSMRISSDDTKTVNLTPVLVERVGELAKTTKRFYYEHTTVRGTLYEVTAFVDGVHRFRIEKISGDKVPCSFPADKLKEVMSAIKHRVEVWGRAKCTGLGEIKTIEVEDLRVLHDNPIPFGEIPSVSITGGIGTREHIERVRGGY